MRGTRLVTTIEGAGTVQEAKREAIIRAKPLEHERIALRDRPVWAREEHESQQSSNKLSRTHSEVSALTFR